MQSINEGHTEQAEQLVKTLEDQKHQLQQKLTLSQIGMQPWNDRTTSFLDFMVSFNVAAANMKIEVLQIRPNISACLQNDKLFPLRRPRGGVQHARCSSDWFTAPAKR